MFGHSSTRTGLVLAGGIALALGVGVLCGVPAAHGDGKATLLLKCDPSHVPAVLTRLAGMDVEVYDVGSMELLPTRVEESVPAPASPPAPLPDALAAMKAMARIARVVATEQATPPALRILKMDVKARSATMSVWAPSPDVLDAVHAALRADPTLAARQRGDALVELGAAKSTAGGWVQSIRLRLGDLRGEADLEHHDFLSFGAMDQHLVAHGATMTYAAAQRQTLLAGGARVTHQKFEVISESPDKLVGLLEAVASEPGIVVTEITWTRDAKAADPDRLKKASFVASQLSARPASN